MSYNSFYHYTAQKKLRDIFSTNAEHTSYGQTGLIPIKRFIPFDQTSATQVPDKAFSGAIFGLLSPLPQEWVTNFWGESDECVLEDILNYIKQDGKFALLKIHTCPDDDIHIADWGVHFNPEFNGTRVSPEHIVHAVKKNYWDSLIPFFNYESHAYHTIPEVICFNRIPPERIEIVEYITDNQMKERIASAKNAPIPYK